LGVDQDGDFTALAPFYGWFLGADAIALGLRTANLPAILWAVYLALVAICVNLFVLFLRRAALAQSVWRAYLHDCRRCSALELDSPVSPHAMTFWHGLR